MGCWDENLFKCSGSHDQDGFQANTGDSRYVDFAYFDTITYVKVIFHSQHLFFMYLAFQLRLCWKRLTWSNRYLEMIFHALDVFSIIFATSYIGVENQRSHEGRIVCFGNVPVLPEVRKSSKQKSKTVKVIYLLEQLILYLAQLNPWLFWYKIILNTDKA